MALSGTHTSAKSQQSPLIQSSLIQYQIKHPDLDFYLGTRQIVLAHRCQPSVSMQYSPRRKGKCRRTPKEHLKILKKVR